MSIVIDIIIVLIMAVCIYLGYRKGLIGVAVSILGFFIALIAAFILYTPISSFIINNTSIKDNIQGAISETVTGYVIGEDENEVQEEAEVEEKNTSKVLSDYIDEIIEKERQKAEATEIEIINSVSETVTINIIKIITAILIFIVVKIGLIFVGALAEIIRKLPIIGQIDKAGGILYGLIKGLLIIYIALMLVSFIAPSLKDSMIVDGINGSIIGNQMYNNNIILRIFL